MIQTGHDDIDPVPNYMHVLAVCVADMAEHVESQPENERPAFAVRARESVIQWLASLVDDKVYPETDCPLRAAIRDKSCRPAYTESRMILAAWDTMDAFDDGDWTNMESRLHDLDEMAVEQLSSIRP